MRCVHIKYDARRKLLTVFYATARIMNFSLSLSD